MNGDILSLMDFAKFFDFARAKQTILTVAVKKIVTPYAFGNIYFEGDLVTRIEEKPNIITYALAGMYVMQPEIFSLIPEGQYFGMDKLIQAMLDGGMPIAKYEMQEYWLDMGRLRTTRRHGTCTNAISRASNLAGSTVYACDLKP